MTTEQLPGTAAPIYKANEQRNLNALLQTPTYYNAIFWEPFFFFNLFLSEQTCLMSELDSADVFYLLWFFVLYYNIFNFLYFKKKKSNLNIG